MSTIQLVNGDCLEEMPKLLAGSVQMVFADLPYSGKHRKSTDCKWDVALPNDKIFEALNRLCSGALLFTAVQPFASLLVCANISQFRYDLIWKKTNVGGWFNANRAPLRAHEHVLIFSQKPSCYNPQKTQGKPYIAKHDPYAKAFKSRNLRGGTQTFDTVNVTGERHPISVQTFNRCTSKAAHPTQKPIALLEWLIKTYTKEGDTVLDPVMGSGTTGVACLRTGRNFVGIEKDAHYFEVASKRIAAEQAQARLAV